MLLTNKQYLLVITVITFFLCVLSTTGCGRVDMVHSGKVEIDVNINVDAICKGASNIKKCKDDVISFISGAIHEN